MSQDLRRTVPGTRVTLNKHLREVCAVHLSLLVSMPGSIALESVTSPEKRNGIRVEGEAKGHTDSFNPASQ